MDGIELLLLINSIAVVVAGVVRTGMNVEGTGWLERRFKRSKKPKFHHHSVVKSSVIHRRTYRRGGKNGGQNSQGESHQVAKG